MVGAPISRITGSLGVGLLADEYGCKKVTMIPLVLFTFAAVITLSWVIGQFLLIAVITGSESKPNDWPYRIPMAKVADNNYGHIDAYIEYIWQIIQEEDDSGKFSDCFRGSDL
ncbi:hypothetical protein B0I72DRAFT_149494 [Yarrowia lipolytica]|nr:hypothetical protein B0I72DRAFT_149494 [Yarrowia lipolytica]